MRIVEKKINCPERIMGILALWKLERYELKKNSVRKEP